MASPNVIPRAIIFDVYGTLLEVSAPPPDADARWRRLFQEYFGAEPALSRVDFSLRTARIVARQHAEAKARGIARPEIQWPVVVAEAVPEFGRLEAGDQMRFQIEQMRVGRSLRLADGAADCLRELAEDERILGVASNSQAYTLHELGDALAAAGLGLDLFHPELRFWSFAHGFSKPDPHVFSILTARLEARGIAPGEILMVGDRLDNDVEPARAHGWQSWHLLLRGPGSGSRSGNWRDLRAWLNRGG